MNPGLITDIANIAQIASAVTIISAILIGSFELAEFRKQRRNTAAAEIMRTFYSPELAHAVWLIRGLPDDIAAEELRGKGNEYEQAAVLVSTNFETMGLMVFERIAPMQLVEKLAGGMVVVIWRKLRPWLAQIRKEQMQPSWAEWFEWLARQCERRKPGQEPAYTKYDDWKP